MDWSKWIQLGFIPVIVAIVAGAASWVVARLQYSAELMKLRKAMNEKRLDSFEGAAADLRKMVLEMGRGAEDPGAQAAVARFCTCSERGKEVSLAAELAMLSEHSRIVAPLLYELPRSCLVLRLMLQGEQRDMDRVRDQLTDVADVLQRVMEAVDISAEARLVGRSSHRHRHLLRRMRNDHLRQTRGT
ncbi:MAG: hypothetical protein ACE149_06970 [Armatimonadota bacterium]